VLRRIPLSTVLTVLALTVVAASLTLTAIDRRGSGGVGTDAAIEARGGNPEAEEQGEEVQLREDALAEARAAGLVGRTGPRESRAAAGWVGERVAGGANDDWEPAVAADPQAPYVYLLLTRYGAKKSCPNHCPSPNIILQRSSDGGTTWTRGTFLCECRGWSGQFDPIIEVVPDTGDVVAVWMNDFNVFFSRSSDRGVTWSAPVATYGNVSWNDKPVLAVSDDGRDVYVSLNGPTGGDPYAMQSHNGGRTWSQTKLVDSKRYFFAFDADVTPDGTVIFSESSISYSGPGSTAEGVIEQRAFISRDRGATWENRLIDTVEIGEPCTADGCSPDFYYGHSAVTADALGRLTFLYDGATTPGGPQRIWARRSTDGGRTWSVRIALSPAGVEAADPAVESAGHGDVRAWYMQENGGPNAWNVWYRTSRDGGLSWSAPVKISDAAGGAAYKNPAGFREIYGDYGELAITNTGRTVAAWGEGASYVGPGGVWINRER
jgi:hypothetical protein